MSLHKDPENLVRAAALLKSLANESRLLILCTLRCSGEKNVSELEKIAGLSQSALSQHLARLRKDKLVVTRRQAQTIYYRAAKSHANMLLEVICRLYAPAEPKPDTSGEKVV